MQKLLLGTILVAGLGIGIEAKAFEFKSLCLGFGPSIDHSEAMFRAIYIADPYQYNKEENKVDSESGLVYEEYESCLATSHGFSSDQIQSLYNACENSGGTPHQDRVDNQEGFIPLVHGPSVMPSYDTLEQVSCVKNARAATPIEIYEGNNPYRIIPLGNSSSSNAAQGAGRL